MKYNLIALACAALLAIGLSLTVTAGPTEPDTDGDSVADVYDNCVNTANEDQWDEDQDGYGQFCDADYDQTGKVDNSDFATFQANFFPTGATICDHDCSGKVDNSDYATFQALFPPTGSINPGPSGQSCAGLGSPAPCPGNPVCP